MRDEHTWDLEFQLSWRWWQIHGMALAQRASHTSSFHYPASCCFHVDELGLREPYRLAVQRKVFTISYSQKQQCVPFGLKTQIHDHSFFPLDVKNRKLLSYKNVNVMVLYTSNNKIPIQYGHVHSPPQCPMYYLTWWGSAAYCYIHTNYLESMSSQN